MPFERYADDRVIHYKTKKKFCNKIKSLEIYKKTGGKTDMIAEILNLMLGCWKIYLNFSPTRLRYIFVDNLRIHGSEFCYI